MVQWLGHRAFKAKSLGSVLGQGAKIPEVTWHKQQKPNKQTQTHGKGSQGLSVLWLRLRAPLAGAGVPSLVGELRSHMLCGADKKKKELDTLVRWLCCWCGSAQKYKNNHDDQLLSFC